MIQVQPSAEKAHLSELQQTDAFEKEKGVKSVESIDVITITENDNEVTNELDVDVHDQERIMPQQLSTERNNAQVFTAITIFV